MRFRIPFTLMWIRTNCSLWCGSGSCSSPKWCKSATTRQPSLHGSILSLYASTVSICGHSPPLLHCQPLQLLNFDLNEGPYPDRAFHLRIRIWIQLPKKMRIRIRDTSFCLTFRRPCSQMISNKFHVRLRGPGWRSSGVWPKTMYFLCRGGLNWHVFHTKTTFELLRAVFNFYMQDPLTNLRERLTWSPNTAFMPFTFSLFTICRWISYSRD
jgi:hypothetical protein